MSIKIAVIGLGHMGKIHFNKLLSLDNVQVSGILDTNGVLTGELAAQTGVTVFPDLQAAVASSDAAIIASPTETHYEIGKTFLEAGKHVFMEKPITVTEEQAAELVSLADRKGLVFQVGHLERFNPAFVHALSLVKDPQLIEAVRISPFTGRSTDVDVVLDLMIHDLDLVLSLLGNDIADVAGQGVCFMTDKTDAATARIEFASGCVANITASRMSSKKERAITIYEKDRHIAIDLLQGTCVSLVKKSGETAETIEYVGPKSDAVQTELTEFADAITGKKKPSVRGIDGSRALSLAVRVNNVISKRTRG